MIRAPTPLGAAPFFASQSTLLRALCGLGLELMKADTSGERLASWQNIDWLKKNSRLENICVVAKLVVSNRQTRAATEVYVNGNLGMPLSHMTVWREGHNCGPLQSGPWTKPSESWPGLLVFCSRYRRLQGVCRSQCLLVQGGMLHSASPRD